MVRPWLFLSRFQQVSQRCGFGFRLPFNTDHFHVSYIFPLTVNGWNKGAVTVVQIEKSVAVLLHSRKPLVSADVRPVSASTCINLFQVIHYFTTTAFFSPDHAVVRHWLPCWCIQTSVGSCQTELNSYTMLIKNKTQKTWKLLKRKCGSFLHLKNCCSVADSQPQMILGFPRSACCLTCWLIVLHSYELKQAAAWMEAKTHSPAWENSGVFTNGWQHGLNLSMLQYISPTMFF